MNRVQTKSYLYLSVIIIMAIAPTVVTLSLRDYFLDTNAIGRSTFIIQELEVEHRKVDALLYKIQGFRRVDAEEIKNVAKTVVDRCEESSHAAWYTHDSNYNNLHDIVQEYCELAEKRVALVEDYDIETVALEAAMENLPALVRKFSEDKNELLVEDTERLAMAYAIHPSHDGFDTIQRTLQTLSENRYSPFRLEVAKLLTHSNKRSALIERLIDPAPLQILATAKRLHFDAVVVHDVRGTLAREILTYISLAFGLLIVFVYWSLQKTSEKLARLNQTLECRVDERTKELQNALEQLADQQSYLAQSAKMSALGEMAGGIAHEINTPLAAISLTAELLQAEAEEQNNPQFAEGLSTITTIVERISKIVQGLKRFSRNDESVEHVPVSVSQVLDDTLLLCSEKLKARGVKLEISRNEKNTNILCAPEQISQVLINLLNNSVDAIDGQTAARKWIRLETIDYAGRLTIRVSDGGDIISSEVRLKLMQPFFTTKQIGKGTGLGLSISKGIMLSHQGTLEFDASAQATTFVLTMPSMTPAQAQQAQSALRARMPTRTA